MFINLIVKIIYLISKNINLIIAVTAITAVLVSICSIYLARRDLIASHRPYVWPVTFAELKDNKAVIDINVIRKSCINAPAEIIGQEYAYIAVTKDANDKSNQKILHTETLTKKQLIYPADPKIYQETYRMSFDLTSQIANQKAKLLRKVRIDYKEISTNRKYFIEGTWEYDRQGKTWRPVTLIGN